jgi:hypothetical protein
MRYKRFFIRNYRAIVGPLEISVKKSSLTPIIGVNESGKTTILHAIFSFDYFNDNLNEEGRHLKDVANLYRTSSPPSEIEAEIDLTTDDLKEAIWGCAEADGPLKTAFEHLGRKRIFPDKISITRNLTTKKYRISEWFGSDEIQDALARGIISGLPYILYFDDFRDKIPDRIEIPANSQQIQTSWLDIIEQLFKQTDKSFSVFNLPTLEERQRRTVLSKVERKLNETLTKEWQTFKLDDRDALKISISFEQERVAPIQIVNSTAQGTTTPTQSSSGSVKNYIKLDVVETVSGDEHFFFISDRSKGFYWFFNFVMKLEFNPKVVAGEPPVTGEAQAIYLLDEPGSYLHAFAQQKLCQKLRQISETNWVAYCTHSHYLLDPEVIPVNSIMVANKDGKGAIDLVPLTSYRGPVSEKRSALQPVLDALQIKPFALDLIGTQTTIITEGIYDYFALELFRDGRKISILPSVGADSIKYYISLMIAWQIDFRALWDNDSEGQAKFQQASERFGSEITHKNLRLLPLSVKGGRRIMQNLFGGQDLTDIRTALGLSSDCSFERTLHALFYSPRKAELVKRMTEQTRSNFAELFDSLTLG